MNFVLDTITLTNNSIESIDFYYDFIAFLRRIYNLPIKETLTGNISLKDIESLLKELKTTRQRINEYRKFGWKLRTEQELQTLGQIKILSEVMRLTYKRKGKLYISKDGRDFLNNLAPIQQYKQMILHYWYSVNWDYFYGNKRIKGATLNDILQDNQDKIWHTLFCKGTQWINYQKFCLALRDYFHLEPFFDDDILGAENELFTDIEISLFIKNLLLFNCVEMEKNRFRSTQIGLYLYQKALYENFP
jgi:hypothetical protein